MKGGECSCYGTNEYTFTVHQQQTCFCCNFTELSFALMEFAHVQKNLTLSQLCAWCSICAILSPAAKITTCTCYDSMRLVHKAVNVHVKSCHPTVKLCRLGLFLNSEKLLSSVTLFRRVEILYAQQLDIFFVIYRYKVPSCAVQSQK